MEQVSSIMISFQICKQVMPLYMMGSSQVVSYEIHLALLTNCGKLQTNFSCVFCFTLNLVGVIPNFNLCPVMQIDCHPRNVSTLMSPIHKYVVYLTQLDRLSD